MKIIVSLFLMSLSLYAMSFNDIKIQAAAEKKLILVELVMESCSYCEKMEKFVLSKEDVKSIITKNYMLLKLDIHKDEIPEFLTSRITPTFYILTSDNVILHEMIGAPSKSEFIALLERFGATK
jgi:thioredoxin-related protein